MLTPSRTISAAVDLAREVAQLKAQNAKLIASLTQFDALFNAQDKDRSVMHVEHVINAPLAVVAAARCYVADDPHSRLAQALAELDQAKGTTK